MELKSFLFKTLIVAGTIVGIYVLYQVRSLVMLFFVAILFGSTVRPVVVKLSAWRVPILLSTIISYIGFLAVLAGIVVLVFPSLLSSLQDLFNSQTNLLLRLEDVMNRVQAEIWKQTGFLLPSVRVADLQAYLAEFQSTAQNNFDQILLDSVRILSEALILFVLAFYWLSERDRFEEFGLRIIPMQHRERFRSIFQEVESTLGSYVRGQLIVCVTVGVLVFIALTILDVPSALVLAAFAAVVELIPLVGPLIGAIPALLVALLDSPEKTLLVALAFVIIQQVESQVLVPKVMERQVRLNPLLILLALAAGNLLGGLFGAIIAIPIAAGLNVIVRRTLIEPTVRSHRLSVVDGGVLLAESDADLAKTATARTFPSKDAQKASSETPMPSASGTPGDSA